MTNGKFSSPAPINEPNLTYAPNSQEYQALKQELHQQRSKPTTVPIVINGKRVQRIDPEPIFIPHDKKAVIAYSQQATREDINSAIITCVEQQRQWSQTPWEERASIFLKAADLIAGPYRQRINAATMLSQSKTCVQAEIDAACELADFFRFNVKFAEKIYEDQPLVSPYGQWNRSSPRGLEGFVFAIGPFNFTSISINLAAAPALMGCCVLWKPAPAAAFSSFVGLEALEEAGLPPGIINFVTGDATLIGDTCLASPDLAGIHFTGSTKTFEYLWQQVGHGLKQYRNYPRLVGETGGKDFIFAHKSANPTQLTTALIRGAFEYQGQKCSAASRAYIPESVWTKIKAPLVETTKQLTMGTPEDFSNFMAAVIDQRSFSKITAYIEHAKTSTDASILCGGEYDDTQGFFIRPTIIESKTPHYQSMVEEIFGPILTLYVYPDDKEDETLALCNTSTPYALTGAIFAQDRYAIKKLTEKLDYAAGNFYINDKPTGAVVGQQPFGGSRKSGTNDKAGSPSNLQRWVSHRTIKENFIPNTDYRYPHMSKK